MVRIAGDDLPGSAKRAMKLDAGRQALLVEQLGYPFVERHAAKLRRADLRIVDQLRNNILAALKAAIDAVERPLDREIGGARRLRDDVERIADGAQRIAQLMADRGGELIERRAPLLLDELLLERANFGRALGDTMLEIDFIE